MSLEQDIFIEKYIKGLLSNVEQEEFRALYNTDPTFKEKVDFEVSLFKILNETDWSFLDPNKNKEVDDLTALFGSPESKKLKKTIAFENDKYLNKKKKSNKNWTYYAAAAIIISFLAISSYFGLYQTSTNELYVTYLDLQDLPSIVERGENDRYNLVEAENNFKNGNYKDALTILKVDEEQLDIFGASLYLYIGISQMQMNKTDAAERTFMALTKSEFIDAEKGYWYLALLHLKNNEIELSKNILKKIVSESLYNKDKAKELLEDLN